MRRISVSAPKPSLPAPPVFRGPKARAEDRVQLERQMVEVLGSTRASQLRAWVALIGETVPWDVVENGCVTRTFQPTEYAIGHAVRQHPAEVARTFGVSESALGRFIIASDERGAANPGRVAACAAGGLDWECHRLDDIPGSDQARRDIARFWEKQYMATLPVFGALADVQVVKIDDGELLREAKAAHRALLEALAELRWKAPTDKKNRPTNRLREFHRLVSEASDPRAATRAFSNMTFGESARVVEAADRLDLDLRMGTVFLCDREAIIGCADALLAAEPAGNELRGLSDFRSAVEDAQDNDALGAAWRNAPSIVRWALDRSGLRICRFDFPFCDIDPEALLAAIQAATGTVDGQAKQNRPAATSRSRAELQLCDAYLKITGRTRPDYSKRKGYTAGDGCPFVGAYVDFLRSCGKHYRSGATLSLADLLPWQLKRARTVSVH